MTPLSPARPIIFTGARLIDPETLYDGPGTVVVAEGVIADVRRGETPAPVSSDANIIDCRGKTLAPGLVDLRVKTGEPGAEPKETLKSASRAAAAGGVTSIVIQPDTDPFVDEPAKLDYILRRGRDIELVHIYAAGAATQGGRGEKMAEIGLMNEAGAAYFTDVDRPIVNSKVMRRVLAYAGGFNALVSHRPKEPWLSEGAVATASEFASRLGLPSEPALAEAIMLERDLALVELTGARLLIDQISTQGALEALLRARGRGLEVSASVSINHLTFNELDIGDYRTFYRLDPPLRSEDDRRAVVQALADGVIDVIVSAHAPAPAEDKRLPFSEAAPGAIGLETLLSALCALHHVEGIPLLDLWRAASFEPARLINLPAGRLAPGAPADLVLFDPNAPRVVDAAQLLSKSKNSPFDGRRLYGQVLMTLVDGRIVHTLTASS